MGRPVKYHFNKLEIGEYIDVPLYGAQAVSGRDRNVDRLNKAAEQYMRNHGGKFVTRTRRAEGIGRCTRVK
jgi:hypothetical protein